MHCETVKNLTVVFNRLYPVLIIITCPLTDNHEQTPVLIFNMTLINILKSYKILFQDLIHIKHVI